VVFYEIETQEEKISLVSRFIKAYFLTSPDAKASENYLGLDGDRLHRTIEYVYGYLAFYYLNISDCVTLEETVKMEAISGLQICPPFTDTKQFTVKVAPQNDALVLYNTTRGYPLKYHYRPTSLSVIYPDGDPEIIRDIIIDNATRTVKRKFTKHGEIDVTIYIYEFEGGICMYYQNETGYVYREQISFTLKNLEALDGSIKTNFDIELDPTEGYILRFKVKDPTKPYSYSTKIRFKLRGYQGGQMLPGVSANDDEGLDYKNNTKGGGGDGTEMYLNSNRLQFNQDSPQSNLGNGGVIQKYLNQQALLRLQGGENNGGAAGAGGGYVNTNGVNGNGVNNAAGTAQNMMNNPQSSMLNNPQNKNNNMSNSQAMNISNTQSQYVQPGQFNQQSAGLQGQGAYNQNLQENNIQGHQQQGGYYDPNDPQGQGYYDPNDPNAQYYYDPNDPNAQYYDPNNPQMYYDPNNPQGYYDPNNPQGYYDPNDPQNYYNQGHYDMNSGQQQQQGGQQAYPQNMLNYGNMK